MMTTATCGQQVFQTDHRTHSVRAGITKHQIILKIRFEINNPSLEEKKKPLRGFAATQQLGHPGPAEWTVLPWETELMAEGHSSCELSLGFSHNPV